MEVHPPHEPVHSWRDALIHIGLMTVGLFIALMLEGLVEFVHHKELVHQARENIRRELEDNHKAAADDVKYLHENADRVKAGLETLRSLRTQSQEHSGSVEFNMVFSDLSDTAWRTARDTGALGYMPYDEVQKDAGIYAFQEKVSNQAFTILQREAEALAPIIAANEHFKDIPSAQYDEMLRSDAASFEDVQLLAQMLQGLDQQYVNALKSR